MFTYVILKATEGNLKGREFVLDDRKRYTLGRSAGCSIQVPDGLSMVSRRHCELEVESPSVRVRDLGSLNGTYVNGENIGKRTKGQAPQEAVAQEHPEHVLADGDELRVGTTVFRVELFPPPPCAEAEPRDQDKLWSREEVYC